MTSLRRGRWIRALLALPLILALPVAAQEGAARAALDTWLEQINGATAEELQGYAAGAFADSFLQQISLEQIGALHQQLRAVAPFEIDSLESETDSALVALLRTTAGRWFRLQLSVSGEPPKIDGILIQPAEAPTDEAPEPLEWSTLDELAARVAENADLPGVALAWARLGEEPHVGVAGVRAMGGDDAIEPADRLHIGSLTKSFTSTALAALVEEGELSWNATLRELIPAIEMNEVFAEMELERLVRHRARIQQHSTFDDAEMSRLNELPGTSTEQRAAYVTEVLVLEALAEGYHYSNAGYATAGYIGERASGRSWEQLMRDEVFEPLGLESCGIGWPATVERPDEPRGHFGAGAARRVQGLDEYPLGAFMAPAGNIHCSVGDLVRYGLAHLAGLSGQDGFLSAASIQELHRVDDVPYAAGWGVDPVSGQHRHNGSAGTFFSYLTIDPEAGLVVAFITNAGPPDGQSAGGRAAQAILDRYSGR